MDDPTRWHAFSSYWAGHLLSTIGDHLTLVALPLAADRISGSGLVVGLIVFAETASTVAVGPLVGAWCDRRKPGTTMIGADVLRAVVLTLVAVVQWSGHLGASLLVVASFALGVARLIHDGAESSLVARLVPDDLDIRSNARLSLSENLGSTVGPILAGAAMSIGLWVAFGTDAVTFLIGASAVQSVRRIGRRHHLDLDGRRAIGPDRSTRLVEDVTVAIAAIRADRRFAATLVVVAVLNVATLPFGAQFVTIARHQLHLGPFMIGAMYAVSGVGTAIAAMVVGRGRSMRGSSMLTAGALLSLAGVVVGTFPTTLVVTVAFAAAGAAFTVVLIHFSAFRQRRFAPELQGRIALSSRTALFSTLMVGALVTGWLSDTTSPATMWVACGVVGLVAVVGGLTTGLGRLGVE